MLWALVVVAAILVILLIAGFNRLVKMRQMTRNAWSDVDVYLKRRAELIPNLVATVQGYAKHEQSTLDSAIQARAALPESRTVPERAEAERAVSDRVGRVLLLAEQYPELRASANFLDLQESLKDTEKLIAHARQYYNACVRDYNTLVESFPTNVVGQIGGFRQADFFEVEEATDRLAPKIG